MPQKTWSAKRERQYAHIKDSLIEQGKAEPLAQEIAARVVNKERAQHGESVQASASSINDMPASRRGACGRIEVRADARCCSCATRRDNAAGKGVHR
jgi:hypothetical protein